MLINYWIVILLLGALLSYLYHEGRRAKGLMSKYKRALEQIRAHGETPVVDHTAAAHDQAKAYRMAFGMLTSIARRALR